MLVLLTRILLWASIGLLLWYIVTKIIPRQYLTWFGGVILILLVVASFLEGDNETVNVIWQILSFPLSPLGLSLVMIGGALSDGVKGIKGKPVAIALAILFISSTPLFGKALVTDAEQTVTNALRAQAELCGEVCRVENVPGANLAEASVIAVLGDSRDVDVSIDGAAAELPVNTVLSPRLLYAADIYGEARALGATPLVLVTAGAGDEDSTERRTIRNILARNGVPSADVEIQNTGLNVYDSARRVEERLEALDIIPDSRDQRSNEDPRVVVVAPAMLMPRAALTFEKMDLNVIARPTEFYSARFSEDNDLLKRVPDVLPSVEGLQLTTEYWDELLKSMYYFLRGWLPDFNFGWDSSIEL